jgi:hypothetical protein
MLKMKVDPAMFLKTQATVANVQRETQLFTRKRTNCAMIDQNRADFLAKSAQVSR